MPRPEPSSGQPEPAAAFTDPAVQPWVAVVLLAMSAGGMTAAVATAALRWTARTNHTGEGPNVVLGILTGIGLGAALGLTFLAAGWYWTVWRERHWIATHRPYVTQLQTLGVPETDCHPLHCAGLTAETLKPWTALGVTTARDWQLVVEADLSLEEARRWRAAGLDARFAAAAAILGAHLPRVRELVADYLEGTGHRADLDDAWIDLGGGLDTPGGGAGDRGEDLGLAAMLALTPEERHQLREGRHPVTWRFHPYPRADDE